MKTWYVAKLLGVGNYFNWPRPKSRHFGSGHKIPKFHFCQICFCYKSFYAKFNAVSIETCYLTHKLLMQHVIAFASGKEKGDGGGGGGGGVHRYEK